MVIVTNIYIALHLTKQKVILHVTQQMFDQEQCLVEKSSTALGEI